MSQDPINQQKMFDPKSVLDLSEINSIREIQDYIARLVSGISEKSKFQFLSSDRNTDDFLVRNIEDDYILIFSGVKKHWVPSTENSSYDSAKSSFKFLVKKAEEQTIGDYLLFSISTTGFVHSMLEADYDNNIIYEYADKLRRSPEHLKIASSGLESMWDSI